MSIRAASQIGKQKRDRPAYPQIDPLVGFGLVGLRQLAEPRVGYLSGAA